MIRKYLNHKLQTNPRHREVELQDIYSYKTSKDNKRKTPSSLYLVKMIAKLERDKLSNAHQNKDQQRRHTNNWRIIKQLINNNRTRALDLKHPKLLGAFMHFTGAKFSP